VPRRLPNLLCIGQLRHAAAGGGLRGEDGIFYRKALTMAVAKALARERHPERANQRLTPAEISAETQMAQEIQETEMGEGEPGPAHDGGRPPAETFEQTNPWWGSRVLGGSRSRTPLFAVLRIVTDADRRMASCQLRC
jgi:hypothetical protein